MRIGPQTPRGRGDPHPVEQVDRPAPGLVVAYPLVTDDGLGNLPTHRVDRIEGDHRLLEDHADVRPAQVRERAVPHCHHVAARNLDPARQLCPARREQAHQRAQGDALAGSGLTENAQDLSGIEGERDAVDRIHGGVASGEAHRDILGPQYRTCRASRHAQSGAMP